MAKWLFRKKQPGEPIREPVHGEFFSQDAVSAPGKALVREGIQNALDAQKGDGKVIVYITLDTKDSISSFLADSELKKHLSAKQNGLSDRNMLENDDSCDFLVFEDFGTTGLLGDIKQSAPSSSEEDKNDFFNFFRAEGITEKGTSRRGSWGVGKNVFWRASRINTVFGLTVRDNDSNQMLLMGRTILFSHAINNKKNRSYQDGYYGNIHSNGLVTPVLDEVITKEFGNYFGLRRVTDNVDSGLSLVVPWPDKKIKHKDLLKVVIEDYFYPIIKDKLQVHINSSREKVELDKNNISTYATDICSVKIQHQIKLVQWMSEKKDKFCIKHENNGLLDWSSVCSEPFKQMKNDYHQEKELAFQVELPLQPINKDIIMSSFDIGLVRNVNTKDTTFVRNDIIIPDVNYSKAQETIALVIAEDKELTKFLVSAENPSHTQWQKKLLEGKYKTGYETLQYITNSVYEIVRKITAEDENEDHSILSGIFPSPSGDVGGNKELPYLIRGIQGGFVVSNNPKYPNLPISIPQNLIVSTAYNTRRGDPLNKYHKEDFNLVNLQISDMCLEVSERKDNIVKAKIIKDEFSLKIVGFDEKRDLYIKVVLEDLNNDST